MHRLGPDVTRQKNVLLHIPLSWLGTARVHAHLGHEEADLLKLVLAQVISTLRGHDDKVRVVLNKSDQVDMQQLMRVYGALMWSLGKVFKSPEVWPPPALIWMP